MSVHTPVLLAGALRSGTTLLRLMLDHHPKLCWFGEFDYAVDRMTDDGGLPALEQYHRWLKTNRIFLATGFRIDQSLGYKQLMDSFLDQAADRSGMHIIGATIHRHYSRALDLWPSARFIYLYRDPRDVAHSWVRMGWSPSVWEGAAGWIDAESAWAMTRSRLKDDSYMEVRHEDLIRDPVAALSRICRFLAVDYAPSMLNYSDDTTYGPPDPLLLEQWRRTLSTQEVRLIEGRVGAHLVARGYQPSGLPPLRPTKARNALTAVAGKLRACRRGLRTYGVRLFLSEQLTRRLHLHNWWSRTRLAMNVIDQAHLK